MYRLLTCLSLKCPFVISFSQDSKADSSTKSSATDFYHILCHTILWKLCTISECHDLIDIFSAVCMVL